ncbi:DUF3267 domain-containing protein [Candidatus Woesearchaeota archaeon]|nr:DUF3267 domain-containing protein [Candidatus Woesearchaeota archaeon]
MIIPGIVISVLTFPGVIVHELGHKYFCDRFNVKVHDVKYFRFGNPAGYVVHDIPDKFYKTFFIDVGPFLVNSILAAAIFLIIAITSLVAIKGFGMTDAPSGPFKLVSGFLMWLGISIAMNAFPSRHDAKVLWKESRRHLSQGDFVAIIGFPFSILIWIANILSFVWFDLIYAIGLALLVTLLAGLVVKALIG